MGRELDRLRARTQQGMKRGSMPRVAERVEDVQLVYGIVPQEGKVAISLNKPVSVLAFTREQALAHALEVSNAVEALDKHQAEANKGKQ